MKTNQHGKPLDQVWVPRWAIFCKNCYTLMHSKYRHDFKSCECGECFVDGGDDYFRYGAKNPGYLVPLILKDALDDE